MRGTRLCLAAALASAALGLAASATAAAQETSSGQSRTLVVVGRATLDVAPDVATISIGVTTRGASAAAAIDDNSKGAAKIGETARGAGIEPRDIRTGHVSLQPAFRNVRDASGQFEQKPDGYQVTNSVQVRIRDVPRLGEILRRFVEGGANRIDGIGFGLLDRAKTERDAGVAAVDDAFRQGNALAAAAGVKLGRVEGIRSMTSGGAPVRPMRMEALRAAPPPPDVPIEAGSLEISAEVEVTWLIDQP